MASMGVAFLPGFENLLVADRRADDAGRGVGHQGEGQHLHAGVAGHDRLGNRGHAHHVGPQRLQHPDLGGRLVARPGQAGIDARDQVDPQPLALVAGKAPQPLRIDLGHVGKPRPEPVVVQAPQRIGARSG